MTETKESALRCRNFFLSWGFPTNQTFHLSDSRANLLPIAISFIPHFMQKLKFQPFLSLTLFEGSGVALPLSFGNYYNKKTVGVRVSVLFWDPFTERKKRGRLPISSTQPDAVAH
jgi:hypothetical protein